MDELVPPDPERRWVVHAVVPFVLAAAACGSDPVPAPTSFAVGPGEVLTQRYDNGRTAVSANERVIRPSNVAQLTLARRFVVDDQVYAQPLVVEGVTTAHGPITLLLVATMNDSLYAFDFDEATNVVPVWSLADHELGRPGDSPRNIGGRNGILSTPVVNREAGELLLVAHDCDPTAPPAMPSCVHRLTAVGLADGAIRRQVTISGSVVATNGDTIDFDPSLHWNRPALLLEGGKVFVAFGSGPPEQEHEEEFVYHGWLFAFDAADFTVPPSVLCTTPDGRGGAIWQGGTGPASDGSAVYFAGANGILGNGDFPPPAWPTGPVGLEESVVNVSIADPSTVGGRYWDDRPYLPDGNVFQYMESGDNGFGSAGPTLVPGSSDLIITGKSGMVYLIDRDTMTARQPPIEPFTQLPLQPGHTLYLHSWWGIPFCTSFVFYRPDEGSGPAPYGLAFGWASSDLLQSFRYDYAARTLVPERVSSAPAIGEGSSGGGLLALSADGGDVSSAVLWAITRFQSGKGPGPGLIRAFDPVTLGEIWAAPIPSFQKFTPPTVVRGHVLAPSTGPDAVPHEILDFALPVSAP